MLSRFEFSLSTDWLLFCVQLLCDHNASNACMCRHILCYNIDCIRRMRSVLLDGDKVGFVIDYNSHIWFGNAHNCKVAYARYSDVLCGAISCTQVMVLHGPEGCALVSLNLYSDDYKKGFPPFSA